MQMVIINIIQIISLEKLLLAHQILQHKNNNNIEEKKVEDNIGQNIDNIGDITSELGMNKKKNRKNRLHQKLHLIYQVWCRRRNTILINGK